MQRYRLRLGDGTILLVDRAGLGAWSMDERAMVQTVGSQRWQPLPQFLAHERALARQLSKQEETGSDPGEGPPPPEASVPEDPGGIGEPAGVQALADEPGAGPPPSGGYGSTAGPDLAVIPLKPLEDAAARPAGVPRWTDDGGSGSGSSVPRSARHGRSHARSGSGDEDGFREKLLRSGPAQTLLRVISRFGIFLSRCFDPIRRLEGRFSSDSTESFARERPSFRLKSLVEDGWPRVATKLRLLRGRASTRGADLMGWVGRLTRRPSPSGLASPPASPDRSPDSSPPPVAGPPPVATPPGLEPPAPLEPPPAIDALPVLRLAPVAERVGKDDIDEEGDRDPAEGIEDVIGVVRAAWPRARRLLVVAALIAAAIGAGLTRETWMPAVTRLGRTAFDEIDGRVRARHQAQGHEQAVREAARQIPHLAPATLELLLTRNPTGILGPAEVFRLACEAVDRGSSALSAEERRELARLRRDLLQTLSKIERDELRDYDRARAQRASFAFEDEEALRLFARGARGLPPRSLERLQELYGKAIAASLAAGEAPGDRSEAPGDR